MNPAAVRSAAARIAGRVHHTPVHTSATLDGRTGAQVLHPLQDQFWGDRQGQLVDPFGHRWGLATHLRDVPAEEVARAAAAAFGG